MSAIEAAIEPYTTSYMTACHACGENFDALHTRWCECLVPLRTLKCAHCESCFCQAPLPYKRSFWMNAPLELRQDLRRFHVQLKSAVMTARVPNARARRRPVVLVVDDDEAMKSLVACFVHQLGYHTLTASDPIEGLDVVATRYVDVVITDALMPKMDGREMCRRIKATREGADKKVIVMTSLYKSRQHESEAINRFGADAMVKKPLDLKSLATLLQRFAPIAM